MLSEIQRDVLILLRDIFVNETINLDLDIKMDPVSVAELREIILKNGILLTVYEKLPDIVKNNLKLKYAAGLKQSILQDHYGNMILEALGEAGLDCIPIKGWEMRKFYPNPQMRMMVDIDLLVKPYNYEAICSVMDRLEFTGEKETDRKHDTFSKNEVSVETHKRLTDDSAKIQKWENDIWARAKKVDDHLYSMTTEDFYIFHFLHMLTDFRNGKLGLRRIIDTWLLCRQHVMFDSAKEKLDDFGMLSFHDRMIKTAKALMGEVEIDDDTELLLTHAFKYGILGTNNSFKAGRIASMGKNIMVGKFKSALTTVFLPYDRMKAHFPKLTQYPFLLPYYWIKRIVGNMKDGVDKSIKKLDYSKVDEDLFHYMKKIFKAGGL